MVNIFRPLIRNINGCLEISCQGLLELLMNILRTVIKNLLFMLVLWICGHIDWIGKNSGILGLDFTLVQNVFLFIKITSIWKDQYWQTSMQFERCNLSLFSLITAQTKATVLHEAGEEKMEVSKSFVHFLQNSVFCLWHNNGSYIYILG